jgi:hypothetical protein
MPIFLHREAFVSPLIDVAGPDLAAMNQPAANVRDRQSKHEPGQVSIPLWPQHEVPMV